MMTTGLANTFEGWPGWTVFAVCDNCGTDEIVGYEGDEPQYWRETESYGLTCDACMEDICYCDRCDREVDVNYDSLFICYDYNLCENCAEDSHEEMFNEEDPEDRPELDDYGCCKECGYDCSDLAAKAAHAPAPTKPLDAWLP